MTDDPRLDQPPILTNYAYRVKGYRSRAPTAAQVIIDGVGSMNWRVWSIVCGFVGPDNASDVSTSSPVPVVVPDDSVTLQLLGLLDSGIPYERRFSLGPRRSVVLDTAFVRDVRLNLIDPVPTNSGLQTWTVFANATNVPMQSQPDRELYLFEAYSPGVYSVPPGAIAVAAYQTADAAFEWRSGGFGFTAAAAVGAASPIRGTQFRTFAASMRIVWRIGQ